MRSPIEEIKAKNIPKNISYSKLCLLLTDYLWFTENGQN